MKHIIWPARLLKSGLWVICSAAVSYFIFITARRYASAVFAMALCPSVCVCVCLSQVSVLLKRLNIGSYKQHHTVAQEI